MLRRSRADELRTAFAYLQARRFEQALAAARPWAADPQGGLLHALALAGSGAVEEAAPLLARIGAANPAARHPVQDLLGLVPGGAGLAHVRAALRHAPDDPRLLALLGAQLAETGPMAEALAAFRRVAETRPGDAESWSNLGKALAADGRFAEAEAAFATAVRLAPTDPRIAYNRAVMLLKAGRLVEGWAALRVRHALPGRPPPLAGRRLEDLDVAGRAVLLTHDEGFGDTLQFIRYAPLLAERGARVIAWMPPPLGRVVAAVPGVAKVVTGPALPRFDLWSPLLDVPALFGDLVPAAVPYLRADAPAPALPPGRKIGLVWAGDPAGLLDRIRSMPVSALEALRNLPAVRWVSLQKGATAPGWMLDPMKGVRDFADTAAIVAQLDAVVSVDTAVAHLAGGLGKPVLLMDRHDNCWRWLHGREDSPWYPRLRIIRQETPGDWAGVVRRVRAALASLPAD
ncbi:MAG: tetratricopeptide repeat protein [Acetobacteraceae bacterium]|nr:tetratricopeptide repeat protein [Acetobacteraceae bacterium]